MDKEAVVHIYNRILLSHKKECIWVSSNEVDEHRAYYMEWSKSEREKQILYTNAYIWNLERWYWWNYLQGSNGDKDTEKDLWTTKGGREDRVGYMERVTWKIILPYIKQTANWNLLYDYENSNWGKVECGRRWEGGSKERGGDICMPLTDSRWCLREASTIL